ncbi:MAG: hypothetical protein GWO20_07780 [Candidatus Korarchaeota archaeon]|nr:hypothetical protein [Candidatus Korarchaeota archaeon]NIU83340.1 hypothetical protein [Candidatus Thorarchaeota archaeon]NIW13671.1 hypothetical protein [Candidatus Thorarchaeota archaeon]NIW51770.1 hypothetical protein [Candidatus Korarchaeota archaeon]
MSALGHCHTGIQQIEIKPMLGEGATTTQPEHLAMNQPLLSKVRGTVEPFTSWKPPPFRKKLMYAGGQYHKLRKMPRVPIDDPGVRETCLN